MNRNKKSVGDCTKEWSDGRSTARQIFCMTERNIRETPCNRKTEESALQCRLVLFHPDVV